jgi:uncharacterized radical SAM superfamily Fe-S cluster-containing enzyme
MNIDSNRIINNVESFTTNNPEHKMSRFSMLIHHKCLGLNIFDLYDENDSEKFKPALLDFLTLREHIMKAENEEVLVSLSMKSFNEAALHFLAPLGLSIYEAKSVFETLKNEEFLTVSFN